MNDQAIINFMIIIQILNFWIVFIERKNIKNNWKKIKLKNKIHIVFYLFFPFFVIMSL